MVDLIKNGGGCDAELGGIRGLLCEDLPGKTEHDCMSVAVWCTSMTIWQILCPDHF